MDLTFVQTSNMFGRDGAWETEFSVDQEFNLHLERESSGKIIMMQKTAGTFFDIVKDFDMKSGDVVYDYDSASFLGTKTIKIVSESAIRFASLTTSGEVTEIKSQSKEIEVTSNGTTEVTPDAGFAYLNSVKVKTNVATSGGASSEEKIGMVYLTKEALFQGLEYPMPDTVPQEEFRDAMMAIISAFPIIATRRDGNNCDPIQFIWDDIAENRITFDSWDAVAINFDQLTLDESDYGYMPVWKMFGASIEEAKAEMSQLFPNQLTENEFFGRA